jgi:hypothetical protein
VKVDPEKRKRPSDPAVPIDRGRLVVAVAEDRLDPVPIAKFGNLDIRPAVQDMQRASRLGKRSGQRLDALVDEGQPPVVLLKRIKDVRVEKECAIDFPACCQGMVKSCVVKDAQIPSEPAQGIAVCRVQESIFLQ